MRGVTGPSLSKLTFDTSLDADSRYGVLGDNNGGGGEPRAVPDPVLILLVRARRPSDGDKPPFVVGVVMDGVDVDMGIGIVRTSGVGVGVIEERERDPVPGREPELEVEVELADEAFI